MYPIVYTQIFMFSFSVFPHRLCSIELQQAADLRCYHHRNRIAISANSWLNAWGNDPWKLARDYAITINSARIGSCICFHLLVIMHVCYIAIGKKIPMGWTTIWRDGNTSLFLLRKFIRVKITWRKINHFYLSQNSRAVDDLPPKYENCLIVIVDDIPPPSYDTLIFENEKQFMDVEKCPKYAIQHI